MYPVMLCLENRECLVVGGGGVALRKVQGLVEEGARVTVVAPDLVAPLAAMADAGRVVAARRDYRHGEAAHYALVFAATDDRQVNREVFADAEAAGVWVNVADDPEICTFHLPARVRRGPLQLAVGSAGEAPFVVRRLRQLLERRLGPEWSEWLQAAARYRKVVRGMNLEPAAQEARYDRFFSATVDGDSLTARVPTPAQERSWLEAEAADHADPAALPGMRSEGEGPGRRDHGLVSLVGGGPGEAGLLTVRGRLRLLAADAIVYDRLAAAVVPCEVDATVELHPVGKTAGNHPVPQEEINTLLIRLARAGKRVVRLKGGDPFVFGRGGEEAEALAAEGIPFEIVPGVTSGIAAPACAGIPVTHRREAVRVTLLTAHEAIKSDGPQVRWDLLAKDPHASVVGYMGVSALPRVAEQLIAAGMDPETPAAMIEQGATSAQRHVVSTIADLAAAVERSGLGPPALFVIGPTVRHSEGLDSAAGLPLAGQRLIVPAAAADLGTGLEAAGAEVVVVPLPVTPAARVVLAARPLTGCVVRSGAEVDWLDEERSGAAWQDGSTAWCVGKEAAERARARGWRPLQCLAEDTDIAQLVARIGGK